MLTKREREIASCIARGASTKEVAERLHIAPSTANNIKSRIYAKLDVHNVGELAVWWFCHTFGLDRSAVELKRASGALICLALFIFSAVTIDEGAVCRRARSRRKNETEQLDGFVV